MSAILPTSRTEDVLADLGSRLRLLRLGQNQRIEDLAAKSGVSARTIARMESGTGVGMEHFVRVLRALGRLQALDSFIAPALVSPIEIAKRRGKARVRASRSRDG
jgi:transcriptional regulator with XRE-family HTH domain